MTLADKRLFGKLALVLLSAIAALAGCGADLSGPRIVDLAGPTMGTRYSVRVVDPSGTADADALQQMIDLRLADINRMMSTYDPESELSRLNRSQSTDWFAVSPETAEVVAAAREIADRSSGAFDPTVGPLVNRWGFGPDKEFSAPPSEEEIDSLRRAVGYELVAVRLDPPAIRKSRPDVYLDLSAIAKGFAVDEISELLTDQGYRNSMVEIGGEVRTRGTKPENQPWRIGIEKPLSGKRTVHKLIELADHGLATSGDYRNFFEVDGKRYSHTIAPTTGEPVEHHLATVSVIADTCMEADALATALLVKGDMAGYDWCREKDIAAYFVIRRDGQYVEKLSPAFADKFGKQSAFSEQ